MHICISSNQSTANLHLDLKGQDHSLMFLKHSFPYFIFVDPDVHAYRAVFLEKKKVFFVGFFYLSRDTPRLQASNVISVREWRKSLGHFGDRLALLWQLVTFLGPCAPWLSLASSFISFLFLQVSDSPALFITPQDQQLLTDSLSVMPCGISLLHGYVLCKCNTQACNE